MGEAFRLYPEKLFALADRVVTFILLFLLLPDFTDDRRQCCLQASQCLKTIICLLYIVLNYVPYFCVHVLLFLLSAGCMPYCPCLRIGHGRLLHCPSRRPYKAPDMLVTRFAYLLAFTPSYRCFMHQTFELLLSVFNGKGLGEYINDG